MLLLIKWRLSSDLIIEEAEMLKAVSITIVGVLVFVTNVNAEPQYKGQQQRDIKAFSQSDIDGYLTGKGMGLAKAAELNHYPGPSHVLDLAKKLNLTNAQINKTQHLFNKMQSKAVELGKQIVEKEQELDQLFADGSIDEGVLEKMLQEIGVLQAKLRYVHLSAHLEQKQILTRHQVMLYDKARGYGEGSRHMHNH